MGSPAEKLGGEMIRELPISQPIQLCKNIVGWTWREIYLRIGSQPGKQKKREKSGRRKSDKPSRHEGRKRKKRKKKKERKG